MQEFLARPLLARLATVSPDGQPHVIPVWFLWEDGCAWVSSYRSTRKIGNLQQNPRCALVVDIEQAEGQLAAVIVEGSAEMLNGLQSETRARIERIYAKYLGPEGVLAPEPQSWLNSEENLLIKITPKRIKSW
jgi:PPOX class probable F420-dependent enzyme